MVQGACVVRLVDSDSNYADSISRNVADDTFGQAIHAQPRECEVQAWMWEEPLYSCLG